MFEYLFKRYKIVETPKVTLYFNFFKDPEVNGDLKEDQGSMKMNIVAGVLDRVRQVAFEKMLWRVSKGNVFTKFSDIEEKIEDPRTGSTLYKSVFMIFFQVSRAIYFLLPRFL